MTREQAINYLRSSGMSEEQITAVSEAFEQKYIPVSKGMIDKKAIEIIRENCYIFDLTDMHKTRRVHKALDRAVEALKFMDRYGDSIIKCMNYIENDVKATIEAANDIEGR